MHTDVGFELSAPHVATDTDAKARSSGGGPLSSNRRRTDSSRHSPPEHFDDANLYGGPDANLADNFKVVIRVRPPVPRELEGYGPFIDVVQLFKESPRSITLCETMDTEEGRASVYARQSFTFDHVYGKEALQGEVYERSARPAVLSVLEGYNATLMAYGQTGTGKTYTMEGFTSEGELGIIPRSIEEIFSYIQECRDGHSKFLVRASYMQIYNEVISDLLQSPSSNGRPLTVRHTPQRGVYVEGLSEWVVRTPHDVYGLIERGTSLRATSSTRMSELSSRSHALFTVVVEVIGEDEGRQVSYRFGKLNIVDLAGSEKVRQAGVTGQRLEETKKINKSLHELGNVISALAAPAQSSGRARHIPFRNSVLTSVLRDSLGGNCKTTLIACISPALESYTESLSTLMFANRAKNIRNNAVVNEDLDQAMLLRKYERELARLRKLLEEQHNGGGGFPSSRSLASLQQGKRQAEEDCEAALEALERSATAHQQEQKARQLLEARIQELEAIVDEGGFACSPRSSEEGFPRLTAMDRERQALEEDKVQVGRYKHLLLKQRDIMLNLTTRLNERDETILQLQEEIDAYDAHVQLLEGKVAQAEKGRTEAETEGHQGAAPPHVGVLTRTQAEVYVQQVRVEPAASGDPPRYRSDRTPGTLITAEEKLIEVLTGAGTTAASPIPTLQLAEVQRLEASLSNWAQDFVQHRTAARELAVLQSLDRLALQLAASDSCCRLLESTLHTSHSAAEVADAVEAAKAAFEARAEEVLAVTGRERDERRRMNHQLERLRFELTQVMERDSPSERTAAGRVWQALQVLEDRILPGYFEVPNATEAVAAQRAILEEALTRQERVWAEAAAVKMKLREASLVNAKGQDGRVTTAASTLGPDGGPAGQELASLTRELQMHRKDRRALKAIMEQRIKVKVDAICNWITGSPLATTTATRGADGAPAKRSLLVEVQSLQSLVNASIQAMDS